MDVATTLAGTEQWWAARAARDRAAANLSTGQDLRSAGRHRSGFNKRSAARLPVPGQKFADAIDRMVGDAGKNVAQVSLRIEAIHLDGLDEGVHRSGAHAAGIGAGKEIILSREGEGPDRPLDGVVAHFQAAVGGVAGQRGPTRLRITDGLGQRALAADLVQRPVEEGLKGPSINN